MAEGGTTGATPVKTSRPRPEKICMLCECNLARVRRSYSVIFSYGVSKTPLRLDERLSEVAGVNITPANSPSHILCVVCVRDLERVEGLKRQESQMRAKLRSRIVFSGRTKRMSVESPLKPVKRKALGDITPASGLNVPPPPAPVQSLPSPRRPSTKTKTKIPIRSPIKSPSTALAETLQELLDSSTKTARRRLGAQMSTTKVVVEGDQTTTEYFLSIENHDIVESLCEGNAKDTAKGLMKSDFYRPHVVDSVLGEVNKECSSLCSYLHPSILRKTDPSSLAKLQHSAVIDELNARIPLTCSVLKTVLCGKTEGKFSKPALVTATGVLMKGRNTFMTALPYRNALVLKKGGLSTMVMEALSHCGISVHPRSARMKIGDLGKNFDEELLKQKMSIEAHSVKLAILTNFAQTASRIPQIDQAPLQAVEELLDLPTLEVSCLGLTSVKASARQILKDSVPEFLLHHHAASVEEALNQICGLRPGEKISAVILSELESLKSATPKSYQLIGDNVDFLIQVKHMSSVNQNKSIHWFHTYAIMDEVHGHHLPDTGGQRPLMDVPNGEFLPDELDNQFLRKEFIALWSRVLVKQVQDFKVLEKVAVWHIPHEHDVAMRQKSKEVPLGVIPKSENETAQMIEILESLQSAYVPVGPGEDPRKIFFGGDQLTEERGRNAQLGRSDGKSVNERIDGLILKNEDWHAFRIAFTIACKVLRKQQSGRDHGTFLANANLVNNSQAKEDPLAKYVEVKRFFNIQVDAFIASATLQYLKQNDLNTTSVVPEYIKAAEKVVQRDWLLTTVSEIVDKYVMSDIKTSVGLMLKAPTKKIFICTECDKCFHWKALHAHHMKVIHAQSRTVVTKDKDPEEDHIFNYGSVFLQLGLLLRDGDDAVREGDGERILRVWKFLMPLFKLHGKTKYAFAALHQQALLTAILSPRQAYQLTWNRTVNTKGGRGKRISRDLRLEHLNKVLKAFLRGLGLTNLTDELGVKIGQALPVLEALTKSFYKDHLVESKSGHHAEPRQRSDFERIFKSIHNHAKVFEFHGGREYKEFPGFNRSMYHGLNVARMHDWIKRKKREWQHDYQ